jgi:hypothetical protein
MGIHSGSKVVSNYVNEQNDLAENAFCAKTRINFVLTR